MRLPNESSPLRPFAKWHEDEGDVLWTSWPIVEPPWVGTPLDSDWPWFVTPQSNLYWHPLPPIFRTPRPRRTSSRGSPHDRR